MKQTARNISNRSKFSSVGAWDAADHAIDRWEQSRSSGLETMGDMMEQFREEIGELQKDLESLQAQINEKNSEMGALRKEKIRIRTGLGGDGGGGGDLKELMAELRKLQMTLQEDVDSTSLLDDDISRYKLNLMQDKQTLQSLDEEMRDYEKQAADEERKQRLLQEKKRKLQSEVDSRSSSLEAMDQRLEQTELQMQEERSRASNVKRSHEMAEQVWLATT
eukprot:SAG11_NODE_1006_length_6209_cov_3.553846_1_plen_221_part_00